MPRLVIDTNLLISTAAHPSRKFAIWDAVRRAEFVLVVSRAGLEEFVDVATRPLLHKSLPELASNSAKFLAEMTDLATLIPEPLQRFNLVSDPRDSHLFNLAIDAKADVLVSLDKKHVLPVADPAHPQHQELKSLASGLRLIHAKDFALELQRLRQDRRG